MVDLTAECILGTSVRLVRRHFFLAGSQALLSMGEHDPFYSEAKLWSDILANLHSLFFSLDDEPWRAILLEPDSYLFSKLPSHKADEIHLECRRVTNALQKAAQSQLGRARVNACWALYGLMHLDAIRTALRLRRCLSLLGEEDSDWASRHEWVKNSVQDWRAIPIGNLFPNHIVGYQLYEEIRVYFHGRQLDVDELLDMLTPRLFLSLVSVRQ